MQLGCAMLSTRIIALTLLVVLGVVCVSFAAPIQRIQGIITEVGEGFLLVRPDGQSAERNFILRWKARFVPMKLPQKGDRVLILYKDKEEGAVIYGVNYLQPPLEESPAESEPPPTKKTL